MRKSKIIKYLSDYLSVTRTIMTATTAIATKVPIPVYTVVLLSSDFEAAVRRITCITFSEIRYQTWEEKSHELIITTSRINADRHDIATLLRGQTA